ncbi:MAG: hypothetical protein ACJ8AW_35805 [Rhodopila sp.]
MISKAAIARNAGFLMLLALPLSGMAQDSPTPAVPKHIGVPSNASPEVVPSLIVLNARGATLQGSTLILRDIAPNAIIFADRPVRAAGHALTADLLEEWSSGTDSFGKDPPNATVSVLNKDASATKDAVVVLTTPKLEGDNLVFSVKVLEGDLSGADGPASVFIDIIGMPLTPLSYAGVARRTVRRAAFYSAAASPYYHPYAYPYPPPPPACGYYPYPPCY